MINRTIELQIKEKLLQGKVIIIYGARQVGKTTLSQKILKEFTGKTKYLNCDLFNNQQLLDYKNIQNIFSSFVEFDLIILDEAQGIENIGKTLKILVDTYPNKQFVATGSSSFDLANNLNEPLTGRNFKFSLYSFSVEELKNNYDFFWVNDNLENLIIYGSYPEVLLVEEKQKKERLNLIAGDYLYKDIFKFEGIKKSNHIQRILQLLALQVGNEVSYNEIGQKLGLNHLTVKKYIDILEQAFIIFKLNSFSRNIRNEITKGVKIYFCDLGIRNSLVQDYKSLNLRADVGNLWENFLILERQKYLKNNFQYRNIYFWRNHAGAEIDYIEEYDGQLYAYEFKWGKKSPKMPKAFREGYKGSCFIVINRDNYLDFVLGKL